MTWIKHSQYTFLSSLLKIYFNNLLLIWARHADMALNLLRKIFALFHLLLQLFYLIYSLLLLLFLLFSFDSLNQFWMYDTIFWCNKTISMEKIKLYIYLFSSCVFNLILLRKFQVFHQLSRNNYKSNSESRFLGWKKNIDKNSFLFSYHWMLWKDASAGWNASTLVQNSSSKSLATIYLWITLHRPYLFRTVALKIEVRHFHIIKRNLFFKSVRNSTITWSSELSHKL